MLRKLDHRYIQTEYLNFHDEGKVNATAATNKFTVTNRSNGAIVGTVRWYIFWRKYCFFPVVNVILDSRCLKDISEFVELKTNERKENWKNGK